MNFANLKSLAIPEGNVTKISHGNVILWQKITSRIPAEYQEVEWISRDREDNNAAYFDLGFAFDTKATVLMNYHKWETSYYLFGAAENSGKLRCMINEADKLSTSRYAYGSNGTGYLTCSFATQIGDNDIKVVWEKGNLTAENFTLNSKTTNNAQAEYTMSSNLYLFAQNYNGTVRSQVSVRLRTFSYYDKNDVLICDLVPCYRKSDGEIGMYDTVRKIFLTNAGTGSFIKGADI